MESVDVLLSLGPCDGLLCTVLMVIISGYFVHRILFRAKVFNVNTTLFNFEPRFDLAERKVWAIHVILAQMSAFLNLKALHTSFHFSLYLALSLLYCGPCISFSIHLIVALGFSSDV